MNEDLDKAGRAEKVEEIIPYHWIGLALLPQHLRNHQQLQERRRQEGQLRRLRTGYRD